MRKTITTNCSANLLDYNVGYAVSLKCGRYYVMLEKVNDVKLCGITKLELGSEVDVAEQTRVTKRHNGQENVTTY